MTNYITKLTPEQEALIPIIRDEWINIGLDTTPTDKQKAEEAIALAYECAGLKPPQQFLWFKNPEEAAIYIDSNLDILDNNVWNNVCKNALRPDRYSLSKIIESGIDFFLKITLRYDVEDAVVFIVDILWDVVTNGNYRIWGLEHLDLLAFYAYLNIIGVVETQDFAPLQGLWETAKHCGWWWAFENVAIVTPKPSVIRLDDRGRLHALGEPAVMYEGFNVYAYHGVRLPEKYGAIHPDHWQAEWLLKEDNAELRRVLIQGIGYARICSELSAFELDNWQEYALLKIDTKVDEETIYLLKMTCPSTGFIHVLRVPPDVQTAKEAIAWINWGISPEEFAIQT